MEEDEKGKGAVISLLNPSVVQLPNTRSLERLGKQKQVWRFSVCCTADFSPRCSVNQLYNNQTMAKLIIFAKHSLWRTPKTSNTLSPFASLNAFTMGEFTTYYFKVAAPHLSGVGALPSKFVRRDSGRKKV